MVKKHRQILLSAPHFAENIRSVFQDKPEFARSKDPEARLYDSFMSDRDRLRVETVRNANERELADFNPDFTDERLPGLLLHYKARNYPNSLNEAEATQWEEWRSSRLKRLLPGFLTSLQKLAATENDSQKQFILEELQLWAESIVPIDQSEA